LLLELTVAKNKKDKTRTQIKFKRNTLFQCVQIECGFHTQMTLASEGVELCI
jgi:hypothetical protein